MQETLVTYAITVGLGQPMIPEQEDGDPAIPDKTEADRRAAGAHATAIHAREALFLMAAGLLAAEGVSITEGCNPKTSITVTESDGVQFAEPPHAPINPPPAEDPPADDPPADPPPVEG